MARVHCIHQSESRTLKNGASQLHALCGAGVMFTCDAFGAHYCTDDAFDTELEALAPHYRFYYDCLMCAWL